MRAFFHAEYDIARQCAVLAQQITTGRVHPESALPDDAPVIARHLHLPAPGANDADPYAAGAAALLRASGLTEALRRYCLLPVRLPEPLTSGWAATTGAKRAAAFEQLYAACVSPLDRTHLRRLARVADFPGRRRLGSYLDSELLGLRNAGEAAAHLAVVEWVRRAGALRWRHDNDRERAVLRAAWIFGSLFYRQLRRRGAIPASVTKTFALMAESTPRRSSARDEAGAADPRQPAIDVVAHLFVHAYQDAGPLLYAVQKGWEAFFATGPLPAALLHEHVRAPRQSIGLPGTFLAEELRPALLALLPEIAAAYANPNVGCFATPENPQSALAS